MSFTFHYCKKIPRTRAGPQGVGSCLVQEMRRFPKSLFCQDKETSETALHFRQRRIPN